jgi:ATP-binding cassette subfamily B protein
VPQDIFLIEDTIASNVAFGIDKELIDYVLVKKVCKLANIDKFIEGLTESYETIIGEKGVRFSGGQIQRIGIARALYRKPSLIVFDEATNSLDYENEEAVMHSINNVVEQNTVIQISHRLNTIKNCDVIYVLKEGSIFAKGTYNELKKLELIS